MSHFNPNLLFVKYLPSATEFNPIIGRKYTLTHSDETGQLFLTIGNQYDYQATDFMKRDEVLAEWNGDYTLIGRVYVSGGEFDEATAKKRFQIFQQEMATALQGIVYGDRTFYDYHSYLLDASIYIIYQSNFPQFQSTQYVGTPRDYLIQAKFSF